MDARPHPGECEMNRFTWVIDHTRRETSVIDAVTCDDTPGAVRVSVAGG